MDGFTERICIALEIEGVWENDFSDFKVGH